MSPAKRSRPGPNSVYVDMSRGDNVQGIQFWARSAHFGGWEESRGAQVYLCMVINARDFSATSQRPIFTKFGHET